MTTRRRASRPQWAEGPEIDRRSSPRSRELRQSTSRRFCERVQAWRKCPATGSRALAEAAQRKLHRECRAQIVEHRAVLVDGVAKPIEVFVARRALHHDFTVDLPIAGTDGRVPGPGREKPRASETPETFTATESSGIPRWSRVEAVRDLVAGGERCEHQFAGARPASPPSNPPGMSTVISKPRALTMLFRPPTCRLLTPTSTAALSGLLARISRLCSKHRLVTTHSSASAVACVPGRCYRHPDGNPTFISRPLPGRSGGEIRRRLAGSRIASGIDGGARVDLPVRFVEDWRMPGFGTPDAAGRTAAWIPRWQVHATPGAAGRWACRLSSPPAGGGDVACTAGILGRPDA